MASVKKRILCFGDSNTWGYCAATGTRFPEGVRWTSRLQQLLGDDYTVIEEGQNGRTTVWDDPIEKRLAGLTYLWPCMESQHPFDLIVIMLGTNDLKPYFGMQAGNIADAAGRLAQTALESPFGPDGKAPKVLLVAPIQVVRDPSFEWMFGAQGEAKSLEFAAQFARVAAAMGCEFLDAASVTMPGIPDGVHLDAEGHRKLAEAMCEKIRGILE